MIEKTDDKYKAMADIFMMYREVGEPIEDKDWDALVGRCHQLIEKYRDTRAYKLVTKVCIALLCVAELESKEGIRNGKAEN